MTRLKTPNIKLLNGKRTSVGSILVYLHYLVFFNVVFIYHVVHDHPFRLANSSLWYNLVTNRRTNRIGKLISSHLSKIINRLSNDSNAIVFTEIGETKNSGRGEISDELQKMEDRKEGGNEIGETTRMTEAPLQFRKPSIRAWGATHKRKELRQGHTRRSMRVAEQRGEEAVCRPGARPAFAELTSTSSSPSRPASLHSLLSPLSLSLSSEPSVSFLASPPRVAPSLSIHRASS